MVRAETFTRWVPTCVDKGPSKAGTPARARPVFASTSSTAGAVVTAAVAPERVGWTKRANVVAFTAVTAATVVVEALGPIELTGVREALRAFPFTT
jgi:hypothetical protein